MTSCRQKIDGRSAAATRPPVLGCNRFNIDTGVNTPSLRWRDGDVDGLDFGQLLDRFFLLVEDFLALVGWVA